MQTLGSAHMDGQSRIERLNCGQLCKTRWPRVISWDHLLHHRFSSSSVCLFVLCQSEIPPKVQLIHNLLHPFHGHSVNALITPQKAAVQYQKFKDFIDVVRAAGPAAELEKFDLTNAYKHVHVHPDFWHLLGIHVGDGHELDRAWIWLHRAQCERNLLVTKSFWKGPGLLVSGEIITKKRFRFRKFSITVSKIHMKNALRQY